MKALKYVHWKEEDFHLGHLEAYPDYMTQGGTIEELEENLRDLYLAVTSGEVPYVRKVDELVLPAWTGSSKRWGALWSVTGPDMTGTRTRSPSRLSRCRATRRSMNTLPGTF